VARDYAAQPDPARPPVADQKFGVVGRVGRPAPELKEFDPVGVGFRGMRFLLCHTPADTRSVTGTDTHVFVMNKISALQAPSRVVNTKVHEIPPAVYSS